MNTIRVSCTEKHSKMTDESHPPHMSALFLIENLRQISQLDFKTRNWQCTVIHVCI